MGGLERARPRSARRLRPARSRRLSHSRSLAHPPNPTQHGVFPAPPSSRTVCEDATQTSCPVGWNMNGRERTPVDPKLLEPLRFQGSWSPSRGAKARVFERVQHTLAPLSPVDTDETRALPRASASGHLPSGRRVLVTRPGWVAVVAIAAGSAVGAGMHAGFRRPPANRVAHIDRVIEASSATPAASAVSPPEVDLATSDPPKHTARLAPVSAAAQAAATASEESAPLSAHQLFAAANEARRLCDASQAAN